jgi:hypothetical protein
LQQAILTLFFNLFILFSLASHAQIYYEINGSPFASDDAPIPKNITPPNEKLIVVDPVNHAWGAYDSNGKLIRWGLATAGAKWCRDLNHSCQTKSGTFRIYLLGDDRCISYKFPIEDGGGAPMPYCMYFNGTEALHGSTEVSYGNTSHGCVRMHVDDAKWLRYQFAEGPNMLNHFLGTKVIIKPY